MKQTKNVRITKYLLNTKIIQYWHFLLTVTDTFLSQSHEKLMATDRPIDHGLCQLPHSNPTLYKLKK